MYVALVVLLDQSLEPRLDESSPVSPQNLDRARVVLLRSLALADRPAPAPARARLLTSASVSRSPGLAQHRRKLRARRLVPELLGGASRTFTSCAVSSSCASTGGATRRIALLTIDRRPPAAEPGASSTTPLTAAVLRRIPSRSLLRRAAFHRAAPSSSGSARGSSVSATAAMPSLTRQRLRRQLVTASRKGIRLRRARGPATATQASARAAAASAQRSSNDARSPQTALALSKHHARSDCARPGTSHSARCAQRATRNAQFSELGVSCSCRRPRGRSSRRPSWRCRG